MRVKYNMFNAGESKHAMALGTPEGGHKIINTKVIAVGFIFYDISYICCFNLKIQKPKKD